MSIPVLVPVFWPPALGVRCDQCGQRAPQLFLVGSPSKFCEQDVRICCQRCIDAPPQPPESLEDPFDLLEYCFGDFLPCVECGYPRPRFEVARAPDPPGGSVAGEPKFYQTLTFAHYIYTCMFCGNLYATPVPTDDAGRQIQREIHAEYKRVQHHLLRARQAGVPDTLTVDEWIRTLRYFGGWCAYCLVRPYDVLEHFIPLAPHGGGTTSDNCVPGCYACNARKGSSHPAYKPDGPRMQRVRAYLETQRAV